MSPPPEAADPATYDHDVFVASSPNDREWVKGYLLHALSEAGISFCDESAFELGVPVLTSMERAIRRSRRTIAVFSRAFTADDDNDFLLSLTQAWGTQTRTWPLVPLLHQDVTLPPRIRMLGALDLRDPAQWEPGVRRLVETLGKPLPPPRRPPPCPYPGMRAYTPEDAGDFVGRDHEIRALIDRLCLSPRQCVVGPSGSGKSSLVLAGVAPRLDGHSILGGDRWRLHSVRPGLHPRDSVAMAFGASVGTPLGELVDRITAAATSLPRLLVLDQAEELFSTAHDQVSDVAELLRALETIERLRTLLTIRADFYAQLMESPLWPLVEHHQFRVLPLEDDGLRTALVKPAERVGVYVEPALVERLIRDASGEPGMLPFLQVTMRLLWERIERRLLTLSGYEALVLPDAGYGTGASNGLLIAMSRHADGALARLDDGQRGIARRCLLRLVQFGEGRTNVRRQQTLDDLRSDDDPPGAFEATLAALTDHRLVTTGTASTASGESVTVDLSHEAMITGWPTLSGWIEQHRDAERRRRRLRQQADEWVTLGRASGGLLDEVQLDDAERYLRDEATVHVGVDAVIHELVAASRARVDQRRRRQRALVSALAATTCFAVVFGAWAFVSQQMATSEAMRSQSMLLARIAGTETEDLGLAGLLALEALDRRETVEARGAVLAALGRAPALQQRLIEPDGQSLLSVVIAPGTGLVAVAGGTGLPAPSSPRILLYDLETGAVEDTFEGAHDAEITALAWSPDGSLLASAGRDDRIVLWDLSRREVQTVLRPDRTQLFTDVPRCRAGGDPDTLGDVRTLAFTPDGGVLVSGGHDQLVRLWDLTEGTDRGLVGHACDVLDVAVAPNGSEIASVGRDDTVRFWDPVTGRELGRIGEPDLSAWASPGSTAGDLRAVTYRPDGGQLAFAGNDGQVTLVATGDHPRATDPPVQAHTERIFDLAYSTDGRRIASASRDRTISIRDVDHLDERTALPDHARALAWLEDGGLLSVGGRDGLRVWMPDRVSSLVEPLPDAAGTSAATLVGELVVGAREDGGVTVWRPGGTVTAAPAPTGLGRARAVADVGSGLVVVGHDDGHVSVWAVAGPVEAGRWQAHETPVTAVDDLTGADRVVTADAGGTLRVWDPATGPEDGRRIEVPGCTIRAIVADANAGVGIGCNEADSLRWWAADVDPDGPRAVHRGGRVNDLELTDNGTLFGASIDGTTIRWHGPLEERGWDTPVDLDSGTSEITAVVVDNTHPVRMVTGSVDGHVQLWDPASSSTIGPPWRLGAPVRDLALSPDGTRLVVTTTSGVATIDLDEESWRKAVCRRTGRELTQSEWHQYVEGPSDGTGRWRLTTGARPSGTVVPLCAP